MIQHEHHRIGSVARVNVVTRAIIILAEPMDRHHFASAHEALHHGRKLQRRLHFAEVVHHIDDDERDPVTPPVGYSDGFLASF